MHFHSPNLALKVLEEWREVSPRSTPEEEAFAALIKSAVVVRIENPEETEVLVKLAADAIAKLAPTSTGLRLTTLHSAISGSLRWRRREFETALLAFDHALRAPAILEQDDIHFIRHWRAITLLGVGKPELAFRDSLAAREYFRLHDPASYALLSFNLGVMLVHAGDWAPAEEALRGAFASAHLVHVPSFEVMARSNVAYCLINTGRISEAKAEIGLALKSDREGLLRLKPGDVLTTIAENLVATGHIAEATEYVTRSFSDASERKFPLGIGTAFWNMGRIAALSGERDRAVSCYRGALLALRRHPQHTQLWKTALAVSELYAAEHDFKRAWRWQRRFHTTYLRWQEATRDIRLAYAQALLELDAIRAERDLAEAERARLAFAMTELESLNVELQERVEQVEMLEAELREQAVRDPLTGLLNRRGLPDALKRMLEDSALTGGRASVAMLDLDRFKRVNDEFGHALGDRLLATAGQTLLDCFRKTDVAFRFGGDEFCVLLPGADHAIAKLRMDGFSERLSRALRTVAPELPFDVTVSGGLATYPDDGQEPETLLARADQALYRNKRNTEPGPD
jgi:diguanylate cyclase (GGDEF)-like protein